MAKDKTTTNAFYRDLFFIYVGFAFWWVKILLQLGSVIPAVSQFCVRF